MMLNMGSPGTACANTSCSCGFSCTNCSWWGPDPHSEGLSTLSLVGTEVTSGAQPALVKMPPSVQGKSGPPLLFLAQKCLMLGRKLPARGGAARFSWLSQPSWSSQLAPSRMEAASSHVCCSCGQAGGVAFCGRNLYSCPRVEADSPSRLLCRHLKGMSNREALYVPQAPKCCISCTEVCHLVESSHLSGKYLP